MITQELLLKALDYNPDSGIFTWKFRDHDFPSVSKNARLSANIFNSLYAGTEARNVSTSKRSVTSYIHIKILNKTYKAHRLAFLYMEGYMPDEVDHLDHNGLNNKWSNLRASNSKDNCKNMPMQKSNKTGVIGVNWHQAAGKWQARAVDLDGNRIDLGRYDSFDDAVKARKDHEVKFKYYNNRD